MNKEEYINIVNSKIKNKSSREIMINQINRYYEVNNNSIKHNYKLGDSVF